MKISKTSIVKDSKIGKDTNIWEFTNIYGCKIGKNCTVGSYVEMARRLRTTVFPLDVNGMFKFRGSMLGGKFDIGVSWRPLAASWRLLKASWRPLGAS